MLIFGMTTIFGFNIGYIKKFNGKTESCIKLRHRLSFNQRRYKKSKNTGCTTVKASNIVYKG